MPRVDKGSSSIANGIKHACLTQYTKDGNALLRLSANLFEQLGRELGHLSKVAEDAAKSVVSSFTSVWCDGDTE